MSENQLSALLAKLKEDCGLREKLQAAGDLEAAEVIVRDAGFDVSQVEWLQYHAKQSLELTDEDLDTVAGGKISPEQESWQTACTFDSLYC